LFLTLLVVRVSKKQKDRGSRVSGSAAWRLPIVEFAL